VTQDPAARIAAVHRNGPPATDGQRAAATALLTDMLAAAAGHGITLADFDWVVGLPDGCLDVIVARDDRNGRQS
jgi:hypothetical protein